MKCNYDKFPTVRVSSPPEGCAAGWRAVGERLRAALSGGSVLCIECYPGVFVEEIEAALASALCAALVLRASECMKKPSEIEGMLAPHLTADPVFGRMNGVRLEDYFDPARLEAARSSLAPAPEGPVLVLGTGASLIAPRPDVLVYADLPRWEIQNRQRRGETGSLGVDDHAASPALKYKSGFFADWRAADRLKKALLPRLDFLLDTTDRRTPKMVAGEAFRSALRETVRRPFRVKPFFDPGPWGGGWMRERCGLDSDAPNYAWCFDCVPEENSLLLDFGGTQLEVPALDLVFSHPVELLGHAVHARFGAEFPIRFDLLDTMGGGNLSLQVHPLTEYVQDLFGMPYTQDESYYLLDAGEDAVVYLGIKDGVTPRAMTAALRAAQKGGPPFPAGDFVNCWPARKHDHFLIPAGTVHCSGRNSMVLEISATPYIFTFKLWDWERTGLDGRPRPIHIDHGEANIQWERTTEWVRRECINRVEALDGTEAWREERTGLHQREFIETRRHWFSGPTPHDTNGAVNVLNLVQGEEAVVESPRGAFAPFTVHYAESFIVPAAVGEYTISPSRPGLGPCATMKAFVRSNP